MDKMREAFEKVWPCPVGVQFHDGRYVIADGDGLLPNQIAARKQSAARQQGRWEVWQHLYPEIERLKGLAKYAFFEGGDMIAGACNGVPPTGDDWNASTTKARLEGE